MGLRWVLGLLGLVSVGISSAFAARHSIIKCPEHPKEQSFLPHQFEKSNYFFCGQEAAGDPVSILRCKRWMFFDPSSPVFCSNDFSNHPSPDAFPLIEVGRGPLSESTCPPENDPDFIVHYPHETDCNLFYRCNWGEAVLLQCPEGLHFNPILEVCDYPHAAGCSAVECKRLKRPAECPQSSLGHSPVKLAHENNCRKYYVCVLGHPFLQKCQRFWHFNPKKLVCQPWHIARCKKISDPPESEETSHSKSESNESKSPSESKSKESSESEDSNESKESSESKSKESSSKETEEESEEDSKEDLIEC